MRKHYWACRAIPGIPNGTCSLPPSVRYWGNVFTGYGNEKRSEVCLRPLVPDAHQQAKDSWQLVGHFSDLRGLADDVSRLRRATSENETQSGLLSQSRSSARY